MSDDERGTGSAAHRPAGGGRGRPDARGRILDALEELLVRRGPTGATLDAVAAGAGVSKGGLLYHFPSKEALLAGLMQRLSQRAEAQLESARTDGSGVVEHWLASSALGEDADLLRSMTAALRGADRDQLAPVFRDISALWRSRIEEEVGDPVLAEVIRLVGDGLYLAHLAGAPRPDPEELEQLRRGLLERVGRGASPAGPPQG